jgi:D-alanyl-D-alanine carboxypeptidase
MRLSRRDRTVTRDGYDSYAPAARSAQVKSIAALALGSTLLFVGSACTLWTAAEQSGEATATASPPAPAQAPPRFHATIAPAPAGRMTSSWRPGCPVTLRDLRLLTLTHWGFDGEVRRGELVVHEDQARAVKEVFRALFGARFPIKRMRLVDVYGGDDDRSMAANNTSGFNCRTVEGSSSWSEHAYGRAIDINPIQNPAVEGRRVSPPAGAHYLDRSGRSKGLIRADDAVVRAFAAIGWGWGGYWTSFKDYQHFSATGR